jgi:hypothetical protein
LRQPTRGGNIEAPSFRHADLKITPTAAEISPGLVLSRRKR